VKVLLDTCIWRPAQVEIRDAGHDVIWSGDWEKDPGDEEILNRAHAENRVLVTLDKDFGELAMLRGLPHSGIIRIVGFSVRQHASVCLSVLNSHQEELEASAIVTAGQATRLRIREKDL
jgi:predicted nuclease of predicted toxin-antitoxin system